MIDPMLSLALSMHSNKGVYALLLGSGVSRSAGIPTGWEVVLDLIRKLAHLRNEDCEPDPAAWYQTQFGEEPDYSKLLDAIAKSPTERHQLLRNYFEPTEDEREKGLKVPTAAHRAIAELVSNGYVRVIITTNFDRLIEKALEDVGIVPSVISTPDAVDGALPIVHSNCTVIKVHGDYLDTRIKNTPAELAEYDDRINKLLDRVFDEFGLIICGWSTEWDPALREAIERCPNRRFTSYWTDRGKLRETARKLANLRKAELLIIQSADSFFQDLSEKVMALQEINKPHPVSTQVAVATLKRYLVDPLQKIRLHDLVMDETEKLHRTLSRENFPERRYSNEEDANQELMKIEVTSKTLLHLVAHGCYWSDETNTPLWVKSLEKISSLPKVSLHDKYDIRLYSALLTLYAGGIAAIASGNFYVLRSLLIKPQVSIDKFKSERLISQIWPVKFNFSELTGAVLPGKSRKLFSFRVYDALQDLFASLLPNESQYERNFDYFEILSALNCLDETDSQDPFLLQAFGCFSRWRVKALDDFEKGFEKSQNNWLPLQAGFFEGSYDRASIAFQRLRNEALPCVREWLR